MGLHEIAWVQASSLRARPSRCSINNAQILRLGLHPLRVCLPAWTPLSPHYRSNTFSVTTWLLQDPGLPADVAPSRACPRLQDVPLQHGSCTICFRPTTLPAKSTTRRGPGGHSPANQPRSLGAKASNGCPLGHRQPEFMFIKPRRPYLSCKSCKVLSGNLVLGDFPLFPQTTAGLRTKAGGKARPVPQPSRCCRRLFSSLPGPRHNP